MPKTRKSRSVKTGLPPGALIHIGERHVEHARIACFEFTESRFSEREIRDLEGIRPAPDKSGVTWINIDGLHDIPLLEQMGKVFGLHPLTLEDILTTEQRPKIEDYGDYLYIVLKCFHADFECGLATDQVSMVLGLNWLISLQEKEGKLLDPIRERLQADKGRLRRAGPDYLAHALIDGIVDSYFVILDSLGERIEDLENALISHPTPETLRSIQSLKRDMILLRKSIWPLREMIGHIGRSDSSLIREPSVIYFQDVYDHAVQVIDTIETYRDMLSGMIDIYLSTISNKMNEVMKVLTIIATVFMPLTFIAGVYGMNFKYMPELEWTWGYFAIWGVMLAIAVLMLIFFKRKKWL
ncbi:MAG TPA: magnesium/cobalt transporter CorA [Desulfatirhabdiaceae bacterium]|nr:magnesium/cobalt transporter CorA [Desulfatirhabdiaceae bacterium]